MSRKAKWFIILMTTFTILGSFFSYTEAAEKNQITLILINQLSFTDKQIYSDISGFKFLEENGAKGSMNINSGGSRTAANSYLSIGSGSRANGLKNMGDSFMVDELLNYQYSASEVYLQQTGEKINLKDTIIFLPIESLLRSDIQKYPIKIGALGETLKSNNLNSRTYGNSDTDKKIRYAPLVTMDEKGLSYGDIGVETLLIDDHRPYGIKTNYDKLLAYGESDVENGVSLIVFDLGDLFRLQEFKAQMSIEYEQRIKEEIYSEIGEFIQKIINELEVNQTLIVASPMVNEEAINNSNLLSPIWIYDKNTEGKILTSNTTKREGIVANIDMSSTILKLLNIKEKPNDMIGESIEAINSKVDLDNEIFHIATIYNLRASVLYSYVLWQIFVLLFSIWVWFKKKITYINFAKINLAGILFIPILLLISAIYTPNNLYIYLLLILLVSFALGWLTVRLKPTHSFLLIGMLTFLFLTIDLYSGGILMKKSFLGYDPIIGARYYGIGNEYMGIYIGSTLLFTSSLVQTSKRRSVIWIVGLIYFILCFILLYPTLGTNAGGAISAIIAVIFTFIKILEVPWNRKYIILSVIGGIIGIGLIIVINQLIPQEDQTHIGKALNQIKEGNFSTIYQTILRKLKMNWRLIQISSWGKVMLTSLFVIGLLFIKHSFQRLNDKYRFLFYGFYGIVLGAFMALLLNDSGIIAASTMIIYVAVPMLYLALIEIELKD